MSHEYLEDVNPSDTSFTSGYPSPPDVYFPVPSKVKNREILAAYHANVPPVFGIRKKPSFYSRNLAKLNKVHRITEAVEKPQRALPSYSLPTWRTMNPVIKLPDTRRYSQGQIYYTRGRVGEKLLLDKPEYDLSDPVSKGKENHTYSALHDPHCKHYFTKPSVINHLKRQQLVSDRGEVLCGVNEFNQYRSYLGELFNDQIKRRIEENTAIEDLERGIKRSVINKQERTIHNAYRAYREKNVRMMSDATETLRVRYAAKTDSWRRRVREIERDRQRIQLLNVGKHTKRHWNAHLTRRKIAKLEEKNKKMLLTKIAYTEIKNDYVSKYDKFVRLALMERYKADQAAIMVARDGQIEDMEQLVEETVRRTRTAWLNKYNELINNSRDNVYVRQLEAKVNAQLRKRFLWKKYFYMWIHFVIRKREEHPDDNHTSFFGIYKILSKYVQDIKALPEDFDPDRRCDRGDSDCEFFVNEDRQRLREMGQKTHPITWESMINQEKLQRDTTEEEPADKKKEKGAPETDGNEADEESDDYVDNLLAGYELSRKKLMKRLKGKDKKTQESLGGPRNNVPKKLFSMQVPGDLNDQQVDQKGDINFLTDMNKVSKKSLHPPK